MNPILEFKNVSKSYHRAPVLTDVSFTVEPGKIVGLLGPNGCGKTTIIKIIAGLIQPTSGEIYVDGKSIGLETKGFISYLPEKTYLNDNMDIKEALHFFTDFYADFDMACAKKMLTDLSIDETTKLKTLSKGTKEKVQLILVMSRKTKLYLLDEPIGGVDPAAREYILHTILTNYNEDASILITTHLIQDVETIFDNVLFLNQGQISIQGAVDDIREQYGKSIDQVFREVFKC